MISPALTSCPPKRLTPRRLLSESRPLRVEPAAFLCAIVHILQRDRRSGLDASNFNFREPLAMTSLAAGVLTATKLDDADLIMTTLRHYFSAQDRKSTRLNSS